MPWRLCPTCGLTASCWSARRRSPPSRNGVPWASPIPTVVAGTREPLLPTVDVVANDDYRGGRVATHALAGAGSSTGSPTSSARARWAACAVGYDAVMTDAGLDPVSVPGDWTEATGRQVGYASVALHGDRHQP